MISMALSPMAYAQKSIGSMMNAAVSNTNAAVSDTKIATSNAIKVSKCGNNFVNKLSRIVQPWNYKKYRQFNKIDIFHKKFEVETFAKHFNDFSKADRIFLLKQLSKNITDWDEGFINNYTKLLNEMSEKGILSQDDILRNIKLDYNSTKITTSLENGKFYYTISPDPFTQGKINGFVAVSGMDKNIAELYRETLRARKLNSDEIDILIANRGILPNTKKAVEKLDDYLDFITKYKPSDYQKALENYAEIFEDTAKSKYKQAFIKYEQKIAKYKDKNYNKLLKKYKKENGGKLTPGLQKRAALEAAEQTKIYKSIKNACRAKTKGKMDFDMATRIASRKASFVKASTFTGVPLVTGAYVIAHRHDEKDGKYWGMLTYDVINTIIFGFVAGKINSGKLPMPTPSAGATAGGKMLNQWSVNLYLPWVTGGVYQQWFDATPEEIEKRFRALEQNPESKKQIDELLKLLEEENFVEKNFKSLKQDLLLGDVDLYNLKDEQTRDIVHQLLAREIYREQQGEWIATGNRVADKVAFYRAIDPVGITKSVGVSLAALAVLCRTKNPYLGLATAMGLIAFDKLIVDQPILMLREEMIGM
jgi:hypothetical protein